MSTFRIAGVQMDIQLMENQKNLDAMATAMRETTSNGAQLTVFPECAVTGYCFSSLEEAMPYSEIVPGDSVEFFTTLCRETNWGMGWPG